ncbi:MAG: hypothetical protein KGQ66_12790 [Acidobacteriota bacterium]|nr:hypothetical protein [Acidobacteriota bacterium]
MTTYIIDISNHNDYCQQGSFERWEVALNDSFGGTWEKLGESGDYISLAADVNKSADELRQGLENWGATVDGIREE